MRSTGLPAWLLKAVVCAGFLMFSINMPVGGLASPPPTSLAKVLPATHQDPTAVFTAPTTSSPIALSNDKAWVWSVNPDDDSVSVINAGTDAEVFRMQVGNEPQSIAPDPNNQFIYVANAADNSVSVIHITNTAPFAAVVEETLTTGAEPWNVVISPDGKRVYVANSGQDTITVIKADVVFPTLPSIIDNIDLRNSACNVGDPNRHFQPRGLAITVDNSKLYVTRFLSFTKTGGVQATDDGKVGIVCRLDINTAAITGPTSVTAFTPITLAARNSGFPGGATELAYPNQLQSVVIRGDKAYLPNIASAPAAQLKFNSDTHAFVNIINGVTTTTQSDGGALNLHLGARVPEAGKARLFFANPWAIGFTNASGVGNAYVVSAGSDLLVKLNVDAAGAITFTNGISTTRYIDLNNPSNLTTSGRNAGKNPLGIAVRDVGVPAQLKVYVMNYISRNISVVNPNTDAVSAVINLTDLPLAGSSAEQLQVGKEVFFSSRGKFDRPAGTTVLTNNRLASQGWQSCSSCHFAGLTDGNVWSFASGPRKSVPLNGTFSPNNPNDQRVLNYSAIFDEVQDFELNIRNVSGPGPLSAGPPPVLDPNHGLLIGDQGNINQAPAAVAAFSPANAGRPQLTLTLPGSTTAWPALDALTEWVRFGIRTPNGMLMTNELTSGGGSATGGLVSTDVALGRRLFFQSGCQTCHGGTKWSISSKDFTSPPAATELSVESSTTANPVNSSYLARFLKDVNSFNLNVSGGSNLIAGTPTIGAIEKASDGRDGMGFDYNADGKGNGFNIPSLLGIWALPPYYHNGACETLACVLSDPNHRTKGLPNGVTDRLTSPTDQARVVTFLQSLDSATVFPTDLSVSRHDIFLDPPTIFKNTQVVIGANISLFGTLADLAPISNTLKVKFTTSNLNVEVPLPAFTQDFGQVTVTTTWNVPGDRTIDRITVQVDSTNAFIEANELNNTASRLILLRNPPPDVTPPTVNRIAISDDNPFSAIDPIATTTNVKLQIVATDPSSPPTLTGLDSFCIVRYIFDFFLRRWVESNCTFTPFPAPDASAGDTFTYTVNTTLLPFGGTQYAFAWVKDHAGNISRVPGFDVISFIPAGDIAINRNDARLFRMTLVPNQRLTFTTPISSGDVDLSVFDGVTTTATRIAISAHNGAVAESVTFTDTFSTNRTFQVEVRAVSNSIFRINTQAVPAVMAGAPGISLPEAIGLLPSGPNKEGLPTKPLIAGPPALQTAIGEAVQLFLPIGIKQH